MKLLKIYFDYKNVINWTLFVLTITLFILSVKSPQLNNSVLPPALFTFMVVMAMWIFIDYKMNQPISEEAKKEFQKLYKSNGAFEYADGFFIHSDKKILWNQITKIIAYKIDLYTTDAICLDVYHSENDSFSLNEETIGWYQFEIKMRENLSSIPNNWIFEIMTPAFKRKETSIYTKAVLGLGPKQLKG